jgi:hypothetical protein
LKHFTTSEFWAHYRLEELEVLVGEFTDFVGQEADPRHASLRLKKVGEYWSARVGLHYRALAKDHPEGLLWWWIGPHATYDRIA